MVYMKYDLKVETSTELFTNIKAAITGVEITPTFLIVSRTT